MTTRGRPPIPIEQKRLKGTLRGDRLPPNAPLVALYNPVEPPVAPESLNTAGLEFWATTWRCSWISQASDYWLVLITAEALDEREALRELVIQEPGNFRARSGLRELEKQLVSQLGLLGFSPSERARLGLAEVKKESKLEELMRRKSERAAQFKQPN